MIEEMAVVQRTLDNGIWVKIDRKSACGHCQIASTCGHGLIEKFFTSRSQPIELFLEGVSGAQAGESVIVGIKPEKLLHSAWLMYAPPLIGLFIGLALAVWLSSLWRIQSEWLQGMGLLVGLFCGFGVCRWRSSRISTHPEYQPRFIRKASETDPSCSVPHE